MHENQYTKSILLFLLLIFAFFISLNKISDYDIWFHLETGEYIVEHKTLPHTDPFSFTAQDRQWKLHDWITTVLYYLIFKIVGFNGLIIFNSIILALTFFLVFKTSLLYKEKEENNHILIYIAFFTTICAILVSRYRFVIRPFVFSYLFLSIFLYITRLYRTKGNNYLWLLPILMALWCNMHYGYIFGIVVPVIYIIGELLKRIANIYFGYELDTMPLRKLRNFFLIALAIVFISLVNPYGWHLPFYGLELHNVLLNFPIMEHTGTILRGFPLLTALVIILFILFLLTIKKIDFSEFLVIIIFLYLLLSNVRFIPKFIIIASPILARHLYLILEKFLSITNKKLIRALNVFSIIITIAILIPNVVKGGDFGLGVKEGPFPEKAVMFLKNNNIKGNMFNPYHFGGYLNWNLFPQNRVFVDGRLVFFGNDILQKYSEVAGLHPLWQTLLTETGVSLVVFDQGPILYGLRNSMHWKLAYWDDLVCVYIRNIHKYNKIISTYEYRYINPVDRSLSYLDSKNRTQINKTIYDIKKKLSYSPECELAHLLLAICYNKKNKPELELKEYITAFKINPHSVIACNNIGACYSRMAKKDEAIRYFRKAIQLNPYMDGAYSNLGEAYHKKGKFKKAYKYYRKAIRYNRWNYNAHNNLGSIYLSWDRYEDAHAEFRTAIGINQNLPDAWYNIACLNALKGNLKDFAYYLKKAILLSKDKSKYINMAKDELCFENIRTKKIYIKLTTLPYRYAISK